MFWVVLFFLSLGAADAGFIGFAQLRHCQLRLCSRSNNDRVLKKMFKVYLPLSGPPCDCIRSWRTRTQLTEVNKRGNGWRGAVLTVAAAF